MREREQGGAQHAAREAVESAERSRDDANRPFGFDRLERSVEFLVEEHQRLTAERAALLEELIEREQRVIALETQLKHERAKRMTAVEGVDKILVRLEQLQVSVTSAAEPA